MLIEKRLKETLSRSFKKTNIYDRWLDRQSWGEIFRKSFDLKWAQQTLDPILGCLKMKKRSIKIHRLEKELVYLTALSIDRGEQLFNTRLRRLIASQRRDVEKLANRLSFRLRAREVG